MKLSSCLLLFLLTIQNLPGQYRSIGEWEHHVSFDQIHNMQSGDKKLFAAARDGIFYLDLEDYSLNRLTRANQLSDAHITALSYHETRESLVVGYSSGQIDLLNSEINSVFREIRDIDLVGSKEINDIVFWKDDLLIATSFGVIVINLSRSEVVANFREIGPEGSPVNIHEMTVEGDILYVRSNQTVAYGNLNDNLLDFGKWKWVNSTNDLTNLVVHRQQLYAIHGDSSLQVLENDGWSAVYTSDFPLIDLYSTNNELYLLTSNSIVELESGNVIELENTMKPIKILVDDETWIATLSQGIYRVSTEEYIKPPGPASVVTSIRMIADSLFTFNTPKEYSALTADSILGFQQFAQNRWIEREITGFSNIRDMVLFNRKLYASSGSEGLLDMTSLTIYNMVNGPFTGIPDDITPIGAIHGGSRLWVGLYGNSNPLWSLDQNGVWDSFSFSQLGATEIIDIVESANGTLWMTLSVNEGGIVVFNPEDNQYRRITMEDGLPADNVYDLVIDLNDEVWIATSKGIVNFPSASFPFDNLPAIVPIFENRELFVEEPILSLAIDGGNRLWASSPDGLWVFNSTLTEIEYFFNQENSPLASELIDQMVYNQLNGEMHLLTAGGLNTYRSNSSQGQNIHHDVSVFPNPVPPDFNGQVGISGLVNNAEVKITDINGKLVRNLQANGSTTSWDLLDANQSRVSAGVYLILSSSLDGSDTFVGKIAVIR